MGLSNENQNLSSDIGLADYFITRYDDEILNIIKLTISKGTFVNFGEIDIYKNFIKDTNIDTKVLNEVLIEFLKSKSDKIGFCFSVEHSSSDFLILSVSKCRKKIINFKKILEKL